MLAKVEIDEKRHEATLRCEDFETNRFRLELLKNQMEQEGLTGEVVEKEGSLSLVVRAGENLLQRIVQILERFKLDFE